MIDFKCPNCGKPMQAESYLAGDPVECPHCKEFAAVPEPAHRRPLWVLPSTFTEIGLRLTGLMTVMAGFVAVFVGIGVNEERGLFGSVLLGWGIITSGLLLMGASDALCYLRTIASRRR